LVLRRPHLPRHKGRARSGRRPPLGTKHTGPGTEETSRRCRGLLVCVRARVSGRARSEEHTSELQSRENLVCRLLLEKKKQLFSAESTTHAAVRQTVHSARLGRDALTEASGD